MLLVQHRTRLKNRIHATLAKYALAPTGIISDAFGKRGREVLQEQFERLPPQTQFVTKCLMEEVASLVAQVYAIEARMRALFAETAEVKLLQTIPGIGFILATVIALVIGDVARFPSASQLASYAGTTPRVHSSGGKTRIGALRPNVKPLLEVGVCRGGQQHQPERPALARPPCCSVVRKGPRSERPPESRRCSGSAPGGGILLDPEEGRVVQRDYGCRRFRPWRGKRERAMNPVEVRNCDCDTSRGQTHAATGGEEMARVSRLEQGAFVRSDN